VRGDDIELVLHFVNVDRDPYKASTIKRYMVTNDIQTKEFLKRFEDMVIISSPFYQK
jgi:hypothetical protein